MGGTPLFSIVIPTRNRPDFLEFVLRSLVNQTWDDFEAIVSDNHRDGAAPAEGTVDRVGDARVKYLDVPELLPMHENWEYGCRHAQGEYVGVLTDKTALQPRALERVATLLDGATDIVSWHAEGFRPIDERASIARGWYRPRVVSDPPEAFDPKDELERRLRFDVRRGLEGARYFRGKLPYGVYRRALVDRIRAETGRVFRPIAPDYTSMTCALVLCTGVAFDMGRPLAMHISTARSNGRRQTQDAAFNREFVLGSDPSGAVFDALPIPRLYASQHNLVAHDYVVGAKAAGIDVTELLDQQSLVTRAREDLDAVLTWPSTAERDAQYAELNGYVAEHGLAVPPGRAPIGAGRLAKLRDRVIMTVPWAEGAARRVLRRPGPTTQTFDSILDALVAAEAHYDRAPATGVSAVDDLDA